MNLSLTQHLRVQNYVLKMPLAWIIRLNLYMWTVTGTRAATISITGKVKSVWQKNNAGYPVKPVQKRVNPNRQII
jgi:hypothetical protein